MLTDRHIAQLLGPLRGNLAHFIGWRVDRWDALQDDPQVAADLSALLFLQGVAS